MKSIYRQPPPGFELSYLKCAVVALLTQIHGASDHINCEWSPCQVASIAGRWLDSCEDMGSSPDMGAAFAASADDLSISSSVSRPLLYELI